MRFSVGLFLVFLLLNSCGNFSKESFKKLSPSRTGIYFLNELIENDTYSSSPTCTWGGISG
jgi:hypothetical protein